MLTTIIFFRSLYDKLLERVNTTPNASADKLWYGDLSEQASLKKEDYPNVPYWNQDDWRSIRAKLKEDNGLATAQSDANTKETKRQDYITSCDGAKLSPAQAAEFRATARQLWTSIGKVEKLPLSWGQACHRHHSYYRYHMYQAHPELTLCAGHWKCDLLAKHEYPSWYHNHGEALNLKHDSGGTASNASISLPAKRLKRTALVAPCKKQKHNDESIESPANNITAPADIPLAVPGPSVAMPITVIPNRSNPNLSNEFPSTSGSLAPLALPVPSSNTDSDNLPSANPETDSQINTLIPTPLLPTSIGGSEQLTPTSLPTPIAPSSLAPRLTIKVCVPSFFQAFD